MSAIEVLICVVIAAIVLVFTNTAAYRTAEGDITKSCETVGKFYIQRGIETRLYSCAKEGK